MMLVQAQRQASLSCQLDAARKYATCMEPCPSNPFDPIELRDLRSLENSGSLEMQREILSKYNRVMEKIIGNL